MMERHNNPEPGVIVQDKDSGEHYHISWGNIIMDDEGELFIPTIVMEAVNRMRDSGGKRKTDDIIEEMIQELQAARREGMFERDKTLELAGVYVIGYHWAELPVA